MHTGCWFALHDVDEASEKHREHTRLDHEETTVQQRDNTHKIEILQFLSGARSRRIYTTRWIGTRRCRRGTRKRHKTAGRTRKQLILVISWGSPLLGRGEGWREGGAKSGQDCWCWRDGCFKPSIHQIHSMHPLRYVGVLDLSAVAPLQARFWNVDVLSALRT